MSIYCFVVNGVTSENKPELLKAISQIGRLISAPGIHMALIFADDEASASQLFQSALSTLNLSFIKADIS